LKAIEEANKKPISFKTNKKQYDFKFEVSHLKVTDGLDEKTAQYVSRHVDTLKKKFEDKVCELGN